MRISDWSSDVCSSDLKAEAGLDAAFAAPPCGWEEATATIMTTDTFPKAAVAQAVVGGRTVNLVGIIQGSGMIAPDMATMLGSIFTDAEIGRASGGERGDQYV